MRRLFFPTLAAFLLCLPLILAERCAHYTGMVGPRVYHEQQRTPAPNEGLDAVVTERETDATVATPTEVFLVPTGEKVSGEPIWLADHAEGVQVVWHGPIHLEIRAPKARTFRHTPSFKAHDRVVTSVLSEDRDTGTPLD